MKKLLLVAVLLIIMIVAGIAYYLAVTQAPVTPTTTAPPSRYQPRITDITSLGFLVIDDEIYWRFNITGDVDLRDMIEINGVHGHWFGLLKVILPNGEHADIFEPPNYTDIAGRGILYLSGSKLFDALAFRIGAWWEKKWLDGAYKVEFWLLGPYENKTMLFSKSFNFRMAFNISIAPTVWTSWSENLKITIANVGDVPIVFENLGITLSGTGTTIGHSSPTYSPHIIMPGETKEIIVPIEILESYREALKGKEATLDFKLGIAGASPKHIVTLNIQFPTK
ncbi:MAG: hypothetical protein P3X22_007895 [Thermoprotei archaeon]|nr:hypothetical protein [Thermoprotei archaeon]